MKIVPKAVIVNTSRYEHGDVIEFSKPMGNGVVGEVGIVAKSDSEAFTAYLVASKRFVVIRHDEPMIKYVGRVTKTNFAAA